MHYLRTILPRLSFGLTALLLISGCTSLKASEAPDAGFLPNTERMEVHRERFPFHKVWLIDYSEGYFDKFTEVMIAPVDTDHLLAHDWMDDLNLEGEARVQQDAARLAKYMENKFRDTIEHDEHKRYSLVESAGSQTMIVELALIELVPTKAWLNVSGNVASFFLPGAGVVAGLASSGSVAIEGRIRDGETGEIVAMFKDRESDQISPIGIQDLTWYKHAENEIDDWADQFVEILDTDPEHRVADSAPLTLRIW